jgi:carbon storage regulator CsrA
MLVLTRKHQEKIRIGDHIVITVLKTKGKTVRLGIEAPTEVPVIRGELSFEGQNVEWQDESSESEAETPRPSAAETSRDHWPTKPVANGVTSPRVSLQRVSREQVAQVLPKLSDENKPLRAMLDRRSVSA